MKSNKKHKNSDDELMFDDDFSSSSMAEFENYSKYDIEEKSKTLNAKASQIVKSICDAYLSLPDNNNEDPEYVKVKELIANISYVEASNLAIMMEQVQIAKHLLSTMVIRFDSGGYVNNELFNMIQEQQKQMIAITMQFSKYARNLPDYFSITRTELQLQNKTETVHQLQSYEANTMMLKNNVETTSEETFSMPPIRGTMDLALAVQASIKNVSDRFESEPELDISFSPDDLVDDDDDDDIFENNIQDDND